MNANELADYMENTERWNVTGVSMQECAEMLRKQATAIKQLRKALDEILCSAADNNAAIIYSLIDQGKAALEATEF
jgi:hypothetical protein